MKSSFNNVDFSSMTYSDCVTFLEHFMHEEIKKLYYYEVEKALCDGIRPILDDVDYVAFIYDAYGIDDIIFVYVDHDGDGLGGGFMKNKMKVMITIHVLMVWKMEIILGMWRLKMMLMLSL